MTNELEIGLKPLWLIGVGAGIGLIIVVLFWLLLLVFNRRAANAMLNILREKLVFPVLLVAALLSLFSIGMSISDVFMEGRFFDRKQEAILSTLRLPFVGEEEFSFYVEANQKDQIFALPVPEGELRSIDLSSDQPLVVAVNEPTIEADITTMERFTLPYSWARVRKATGPFIEQLETLHVDNDGDEGTYLVVKVVTDIIIPESRAIPLTAVGLVAFVSTFLLMQWLFPKIAAVALTTGKEAVTQPLFRLTVVLGGFLILLLVFLPYFTFGDDVKMYKEACLQIIMLLAMFMAIWTSSIAVADEIEGRTALTVLSKPISRQQFVIGKYVGIALALALLFILLGTLFVGCVSYKVAYDARESANSYITWMDSSVEIMRALPGLVLAFMEAAVLASIAVAISTRLPVLANLIICMGIYVVGHLLPLFVQSSVGEFAIVQFMGQLFATVLPVLEHFNIYGAIAAGKSVPISYLLWMGGYSLILITISMLLALVMFDDRDLT
ncbi:MAG: ABC transporter permease [Planctomycetales bacterium]